MLAAYENPGRRVPRRRRAEDVRRRRHPVCPPDGARPADRHRRNRRPRRPRHCTVLRHVLAAGALSAAVRLLPRRSEGLRRQTTRYLTAYNAGRGDRHAFETLVRPLPALDADLHGYLRHIPAWKVPLKQIEYDPSYVRTAVSPTEIAAALAEIIGALESAVRPPSSRACSEERSQQRSRTGGARRRLIRWNRISRGRNR